jgi:DNA polymerase
MGSFGESIPEVFNQAVAEGWTFSAFNAMFEQLVWKYRWPSLPSPVFQCTRALVAAHGLPQSLDRACKALHIGYSKDIEGARLIKTYCKPNKEGGFNDLKGEDASKMLAYCAKDVILSRRIRQRLPALRVQEQEVYGWTVKTNLRGLLIDPELAQKAEEIAQVLLKKGNEELGVLTNGTILAVSQVERIKKYLAREFAVEAESWDKESIQELLLSVLPSPARRILELRRDLAQSSVKKFGRTVAAVCPDGQVRDTLVYHGAATGRFTSQVVQFQNLPRAVVKDPETAIKLIKQGDAEMFDMAYKHPMQALSACLRGLIIPSKGKALIVVDYAAIEARVLMWAAGQEDAVADFHAGRDIYVEMARTIYNNPALTIENKEERFLGKTTILGCGYSMAHVKFQATCEGYGIDLGEKTEYVDRKDSKGNGIKVWYSPLAKQAVEEYRQKYSKVPELWYGIEDAARVCVRTKKATEYGRFRFSYEREFLYLTLPSGRRLAYQGAGMDKEGLYYYTEDSQTRQYGKKRTYGGRLVENAIQATARDILVHGILNLEKQGYPVIMTVHDENIVEVPIGQEGRLKDVIKIMCSLPAWAEGCPVGAEGFVCSRYKKG